MEIGEIYENHIWGTGSGKTFVAARLLLDDLMAGNKVPLCTEDPILLNTCTTSLKVMI